MMMSLLISVKSSLNKVLEKRILISSVIFFIALSLRLSLVHHPFWVDEFSSAEQAKQYLYLGFELISSQSYYFEPNNLFTHALIAVSFTLFGVGELQARLPFMVIGSIVPVILYFLVKKHFSSRTAITASALYIFSYWQITWARQARGYVLQQFLILLTIFFYTSWLTTQKKKYSAFLVVCSILGILTHTTFVLLIGALLTHFVLFSNFRQIIAHNWRWLIVVGILLVGSIVVSGQFISILNALITALQNPSNNLRYYHSFLWREQTLLTFLSIWGGIYLLFKSRDCSVAALLGIPIVFVLFFVSFLFAPFVSRYVLPIAPLLIIFASVTIVAFSESVSKKSAGLWTSIIVIFLVLNGDAFVFTPERYVSVNYDMREIAIINYDEVYERIEEKSKDVVTQTAFIDTWNSRLKWYRGENVDNLYIYRWLNDEELINGLPRTTLYRLNENGEKFIPKSGSPALKLIGEQSDLESAMRKHPYGFIFIDDSTLPQDVQDYAKENMHHELYIDSYAPELLENPYSRWPANLYSWGFESPNPFYDASGSGELSPVVDTEVNQ